MTAPGSRLALLSFVLFACGSACSSGDSTRVALEPLALPASSSPAPAIAQARASAVIEALAAYGPIARGLARRAPLALRGEGFARREVAKTAPLREVILPRRASEAVHLSPRLAEDAWVDVSSLDLTQAPGALGDGAVVYEGAAPATDLVLTAEPARVEETRLLRDATAPTTFRWGLELGPGIADAHVRAGMVELADAKGYVQLSTEVAIAIDAQGVERPLDVRLEGTGRTRTLVATLDARGLAYPIAVDPVWTTAPSQPGGPHSNVAITLPGSGRVLVIGGYSPYTCLYDPKTNTWSGGSLSGSTVPNVPIPFGSSTTPLLRAALLASGDVLVVAGGTDTSVAIFHDATTTYTVPTSKQVAACAGCGLATLPDGRVFKVNGGTGNTTELYDPTAGTWAASDPTPFSPQGDALVLALRGPSAGKVLLFGSNPAQIAAMWTSGSGWSPLITGRRFVGARGVALADGRALIGGYPSGSGAPPMVASLYQPSGTTLTVKDSALSPMAQANVGYALLPSGLVLAAGGESTATTPIATAASAIYDPVADLWTSIDPLPAVQAEQAMALLPSGAVLSVGGVGNYGSPGVAAQLYTPLAQGASCASPAIPQTCGTGNCVDGVCCSVASCPNGVCNAPAVTGRVAGACALNDGQVCGHDYDCASNHCVDGVCCNTACTGQCEQCNAAATKGTCTAVTGAPIAPRSACTGVGVGTVCGPSCDGTHRAACSYAPAGTVPCADASCTAGVMKQASTCDGAGLCPTTTKSCGAYACGATACVTTCANDTSCAAGYFCSGSACVPKVGLGTPCTSASACAAGTFCTDGFCCGVASCGAGASCALGKAGGPILPGTCAKLNGSACTADAECGSQHCADGVCCDTACGDQCAACDVAGKVGTCSPVSGAPHGTKRAPCDDGGTNACAAKRCDGTSATSACHGFVHDGTFPCAPAACEGGSLRPAAKCDGAGACAAPALAACGEYGCDPSGPACRTSCATDGDCAAGYRCAAGHCSNAPTCSDDRTKSIDPSTGAATDCAPYKCSGGLCATSCASEADCQGGLACDKSAGYGRCGATPTTPPASDSSGGCAVGAQGGGGGATLGLAAVAALMVVGRARRRLGRGARR
jgi:hypothetical protein